MACPSCRSGVVLVFAAVEVHPSRPPDAPCPGCGHDLASYARTFASAQGLHAARIEVHKDGRGPAGAGGRESASR